MKYKNERKEVSSPPRETHIRWGRTSQDDEPLIQMTANKNTKLTPQWIKERHEVRNKIHGWIALQLQ
ncbi:hypothetical protein ES319_A11G088700v1 [Gossypium barbadense]|uniref:Uncharacterized protein n=2 Tax=Gossypium TaxID=3633 RepID=A0A5J5TKC6_GOSBA|nr:hypothetical protein ES319_A11G088700v1 [Gossypium barbadense]TYG93227.1 hypothetical protein ES288_A11G093900v1 [Gossypium darwinii]